MYRNAKSAEQAGQKHEAARHQVLTGQTVHMCRIYVYDAQTLNLPFETQLLQSVILFSELISITVTVTVIIFPGINYKTVMW